MRALVTGGAGFIGSTLVDRLIDAGHEVVVVDDLSSGSEANLAVARERAGDRLRLEVLDIREPRTTDVVAAAAPEVVFHLAAQADVRVSVADPVLDAEINLIGMLRVCVGALRAGNRKIVFASSGGTIYGEPAPEALPVDEHHAQQPVSPYGVAKKAGNDYLFALAQLHDVTFTSLALANVYGPRQDPHGEAGVVAIFAGRLLGGEPCTIFGDGSQTRDFVYVGDVVDAFVRAGELGVADGEVCNIGTGAETSVVDLYREMARAAGSDAEPTFAPPRPGELQRSCLDPAKAQKLLGWEIGHDLTAGVAETLRWFAGR